MDSVPPQKRPYHPWIGKVTHGQSNTVLYRRWAAMRIRCTRAKNVQYKDYGGRGISVCPEWNCFENFYVWAILAGFREDLELDRRDNDGNYCPENCRWVPKIVNNHNSRHVIRLVAWGETKLMKEWARDDRCVVKYTTLWQRLKAGWSVEKALTLPLVTPGNPNPVGRRRQ